MPPLGVFFSVWSLDPWALALVLAAGTLYGVGLAKSARAGTTWPLWRVLAFYILGLGSYAWVSFGFLGTYSAELRWAFSIRLALLLFVVPMLMALGLPLGVARAATTHASLRARLSRLATWPLKFFGNSTVAPVIGLVAFSVLLTPLAGIARLDPVVEALLGVCIPLLGLLLVLPVTEAGTRTTTSLLMLQFVFAFIELLADAIPGVALRLNTAILDHAAAPTSQVPPWFPNPLRDQQLAGDWLWFICEAADLPIMILLFVQFSRTDKGERKVLDAMSDEEMDALNAVHLRNRG
ncbi:cytochrome c oxidase assembly protein [Arthrobacter sp. 35W]|uniref:cytochrome c oxidase assembly protein n=1 Tax=Arthrobacter sp. 35W TaxID=1132441 RepID=UPI0004196B60|nr:cytochrome c oxidase assembly protein [Arthrobacter sp. 35W]